MSASARPAPHPTSVPETAPADKVVLTQVEPREARRSRLSTGVLVALIGVALLLSALGTHGQAHLALTDALVENPVVWSLPALPLAIVCGLVCVSISVLYFYGRLPQWVLGLAGAVAALAAVCGFLMWAAADKSLAFGIPNQLMGTLVLATPLVFGALCGTLCERAGVVNVAIEGQMLTAAFTAAVVGSITQNVWIALLVAIIAAVAMAAILALFAINYLVDQVVLGVVINLLAVGLTGFLFDSLVKTDSVKLNNAPLMDKWVLVWLALASVILVWLLLFLTKWGLRVRAVGEHPKAADTVGISVTKIRWSAVLVGGIFAGMGGAFFTIGSTGSFVKEITVGNGFIALAALIMGRWHPVLAALVALFFGFVTQLSSSVQMLGTPLPSQFLLLLPYIATIIAVAGLVGRVRAPAADGKPYVK